MAHFKTEIWIYLYYIEDDDPKFYIIAATYFFNFTNNCIRDFTDKKVKYLLIFV